MPPLERLENLFRFLLPPACREHVLGDLHERSKSSRRKFLVDALWVVGPVVISRIRRTTDFQILLIETVAVYLSFSAAAWGLGQKAFLYDRAGFARLAIPTTVAVAALLMCNAYADSEKRYWVKPLLQSAGSISLAFWGQAVLFDTRPSLTIPFWIMLYGSCTGVLVIAASRTMFPPIDAGLRIASLNDLRLRQQPDLASAKAPSQQIHRRITEIQSSAGLKIAFASGSALLLFIAAVFGSTSWHGSALKPQFMVFVLFVFAVVYKFCNKE